MRDFVALDFETANGKRSSICSVGAVVVKNGEIVDSFYSLVKPTPNYYAWFCQEVHGLGYLDTDDADFFPEVWERLLEKVHAYFPYIEDGEVPFLPHMRLLIQNMSSATRFMLRTSISAVHWKTTNYTPSPLPAVMI